MLSKQDYRLMAGTFRKVYLGSRTLIYQENGALFREILKEFMEMLAEDNPRFNPDYFMNFIVHGTERPKSPQQSSTEGLR